MSDNKTPTSPSAGSGGTPAACTTTPCPDAGKYGTAITIEGTDEFKKKTKECLDALNSTPTGAKMIKSIEDSGKKVTFKETSGGNSASPLDGSKATRNDSRRSRP